MWHKSFDKCSAVAICSPPRALDLLRPTWHKHRRAPCVHEQSHSVQAGICKLGTIGPPSGAALRTKGLHASHSHLATHTTPSCCNCHCQADSPVLQMPLCMATRMSLAMGICNFESLSPWAPVASQFLQGFTWHGPAPQAKLCIDCHHDWHAREPTRAANTSGGRQQARSCWCQALSRGARWTLLHSRQELTR